VSANPFVVRVPRHHWGDQGKDMRSTLMTWNWHWSVPKGRDAVLLDFSANAFMEPWALALFACYGMTISKRHGIPLEVTLDDAQPSNKYFKLMGLQEVVETDKSTAQWDDSKQNTGLHVIRRHEDVIRFSNSFAVLGKRKSLTATLDALKYGIVELGRNVVQHAGSQFGGVALAQYFPDQRRVQVAIADTGIGVRSSLSRTYPDATKDDLSSLKLAILPHVSGAVPEGTYSGNENAGLGLFFCKEICWRTGGWFWIYSGRAVVGIHQADESGSSRIYRLRLGEWPGTVVVMDLPEEGVTEAGFESILATCRELADKARKDRQHHYLDFLDKDCDISGFDAIEVGPFIEDVGRARQVKQERILPTLANGGMLILDFAGVRFATQSFVHALLSDVFKERSSVASLSFRNCSRATEEAIRAVAAYSMTFAPNR
jgi:hypothetical protein